MEYRIEPIDTLYGLAFELNKKGLVDAFGVIALTGDRLHCCDQAAVCHKGDDIIGVVTIAPFGESCENRPTLVGAWVHPTERGNGIFSDLVVLATKHVMERNLLAEGNTIRIDLMTLNAKMAWQRFCRKNGDLQNLFTIYDYTGYFLATL